MSELSSEPRRVWGKCDVCKGEIEYGVDDWNGPRIFPIKGEYVFRGALYASAPIAEGEDHPKHLNIHIIACSKKCLIKRLREIKEEDLGI